MISTQSGQPSLAREDSVLVPQAYNKDDRGSCLERLPFSKKGSHPTPEAYKKRRRVFDRLKTPGSGVEDFVPWVFPISSHPILGKRKKRRTRWLILFTTSAHGSANEVPTLNRRLVLPLRWSVRLVNNHPVRVWMYKR